MIELVNAPVDEPQVRARRRPDVAHVVVAVVAAALVAFAIRRNPLLSPDSVTYLSAADRLRGGHGLVDFTGEPLTHFPPVFPLLLAPGGRSLLWASIVGIVVAAVVAVLLYDLLASRVRQPIALVATLVYACSQATMYFETTVWSETPYLVFALAMLGVLGRGTVTMRRCAVAGLLAGLGFLTRYVGAGLVVAGLVIVLATAFESGGRSARRRAVAFLAPPGILAAGWVLRNLLTTGEPLGPHFEGAARSSPGSLLRQVALGLGQLVSEIQSTSTLTRSFGYVTLGALVACAGWALARPPRNRIDVGMVAFAAMSIAVPVASRVLAGTDLSARLLSPTLVAIVYFAAVTVDRWRHHRVVPVVAGAIAVIVTGTGVAAAADTPDRLVGSADNAELYAPELYALVAALPDDARVLTNNPQRVWWHSRRFPVQMGFTVPKPGNSHFPLSVDETLRVACDHDAYLAWFATLLNAENTSPAALRPDIAQFVSLTVLDEVPGGTLYALDAADPATCE